MKRQSAKEIERETAKKELLEILKPGDTVYCVLRHVSRSGMQREISFMTERMRCIDSQVCDSLGMRWGKHNGVVVGGCGMDMGFHVVYNLAYVLFPDGFGCTGRSEHPNICPSNDHSNGDRDYTQHGLSDENGNPENREPGPGEKADGCKNHWHNSGGYALRHRWI